MMTATHSTSTRLAPLVGIVLMLVLFSSTHAMADPPQALPAAGGMTLEAVTTAPLATGEGKLALVLQKPEKWGSESATHGLLLRPTPNPGDVGAIALVLPLANALGVGSEADSAMAILDEWASDTSVVERQAAIIKDEGGVEIPSTLILAKGLLSDGRAAHFLILHTPLPQGTAVIVAGASDALYGPFEHVLRDILTTALVRVTP